MNRREACQLLKCNLIGLAIKLKITDSAVAQWGDDRDIPKLREYQVRELADSESKKNIDSLAGQKNIQN